jgi:dUTP pyrophosphatase
MFIKIKKTHPDAVIPTYGTDGAGAFDIYAITGGRLDPGNTLEIETGMAFEIPPGFALMIYSRSGHGFKYDVKLCNATGIIDSDFRGSVKVKLERFNDENSGWDSEEFLVLPGDRIAQGIILPVPHIQFIETETLSETARGTGGFGSTGA